MEQPIPHTVGSFPCLDFVNSRFSDHVAGDTVMDRLEAPAWRRRFLERWHLASVRDAPRIAALKAARETLRRVLEDWASGRPLRQADLARLDSWLAAAPMRRQFNGEMAPIRRDWSWVLAEVVASTSRLLATGEPKRLKVCANPACTWVFLDESRNLSRRWCDPATCGNLMTVRAFRRRQRAASTSG